MILVSFLVMPFDLYPRCNANQNPNIHAKSHQSSFMSSTISWLVLLTDAIDRSKPTGITRNGLDPIVGTRPVEVPMASPGISTKLGNHFVKSGLKVMMQETLTVAFVSTHDQNAMATLSNVKSVVSAVMLSIYSRMVDTRHTLR